MAAPTCRQLFWLCLSVFFCSVLGSASKRQENDINSTRAKLRDKSSTFVTENYGGHNLWQRKQVAEANLRLSKLKLDWSRMRSTSSRGSPPLTSHAAHHEGANNLEASGIFNPGDPAPAFTLPTLNGLLKYPGAVLTSTTPILFHAYTPHSAYLRCVWNCSGSLEALIAHSPSTTHYVFLSDGDDAYSNSLWMQARFKTAAQNVLTAGTRTQTEVASFLARLHFVTLPTYQLGTWLPTVFKQWTCPDHNCGLDQAVFTAPGKLPLVLPRLDARYDWLPGFPTGKTFAVSDAGDGCTAASGVKGKVVMVTDTGCSYFKKIVTMQSSGAAGVVIVQTAASCPQDINCLSQSECSTPINIPVTMITPLGQGHQSASLSTVTFQNTPSDNFFFGIDHRARLAEVGWLLYPSFHFLAWQAQWFDFKAGVEAQLAEKALVIPILNNTAMRGKAGASANITLPPLSQLSAYSQVHLDMALSCPGDRDMTCPHWDHTVQLFVCCDKSSTRCGMELGRWISPFRRRIGRWLTDITPLLPLLDGGRCTFTLKTVPWAMMWKPSLNLRFSGLRETGSPAPYLAVPLYSPGATFDIHYNAHFTPYMFKVPSNVTKVEIVSVITGHGSDENGCGEFCVTSHHFVVNDAPAYNKTFDNAGSPLGCAERVPEGVEPNEHGTWLYGRDGWCDGQQVSPWVIDITPYIKPAAPNTVRYFGWFQGTDPNPKHSPGLMTVYSYMVFYKGT